MKPDFGYFEETQLGKPYDFKLMKRLYPFTQPYRLLLFGSIGLVLLITALDLALPYVTKIAIDRYIVPLTASEAPVNAPGQPTAGKVIRISPPLVMPLDEAREYLEVMRGIFASVRLRLR